MFYSPEVVNVILHGKRDSADVVKSRFLRWGDGPGLSMWAQSNHRVFLQGRQEGHIEQRCDDRSRGERNLRMPNGWAWWWRKGPQVKKCRQPLKTGKGKKHSPLEPPRRMQPWQHLDFMTSGFQNCKLVNTGFLFQPTKFVKLVRAAIEN